MLYNKDYIDPVIINTSILYSLHEQMSIFIRTVKVDQPNQNCKLFSIMSKTFNIWASEWIIQIGSLNTICFEKKLIYKNNLIL